MKKLLLAVLGAAAITGASYTLMGSGLGLNTYLENMEFISAVADSMDTISITIPPRPGFRPVITACVIKNDTAAQKAYFLLHNITTTLAGAMAASAVQCTLTDTVPDAGGSAPDAGDIFVIERDDQSYQTVTCSVYTTGGIIEFRGGEAKAVAVSAGNKVWAMGAAADANCLMYQLTARTTVTIPAECIFGKVSGPMCLRVSCTGNLGADTLKQMAWAYMK